jgi:Growth-Arrest-Specific Protein 2 Domain
MNTEANLRKNNSTNTMFHQHFLISIVTPLGKKLEITETKALGQCLKRSARMKRLPLLNLEIALTQSQSRRNHHTITGTAYTFYQTSTLKKFSLKPMPESTFTSHYTPNKNDPVDIKFAEIVNKHISTNGILPYAIKRLGKTKYKIGSTVLPMKVIHKRENTVINLRVGGGFDNLEKCLEKQLIHESITTRKIQSSLIVPEDPNFPLAPIISDISKTQIIEPLESSIVLEKTMENNESPQSVPVVNEPLKIPKRNYFSISLLNITPQNKSPFGSP